MELEIRHLRAICAIGDAGSLSRAATQLGISQPSLTTLLQRVERLVGGKLFDRGRAGAEPTALGAQMLQRARLLLVELDAFGSDMTQRDGPSRLGSVHMECVASLYTRLEEVLTDITLVVDPSSTGLALALANGHLDAAVIAVDEDADLGLPRGVAQRVVVPWVPVYIAIPAAHRLASKTEVELADLAGESWVGPPGAEDGSLTSLRAACRAVGFVPRIRFEMPSGAGRQLIAAGKAVQLVEPTSQGGPGVAVRPLAGAPMRMRLVFAWRRERLTWSQASRVFAEVLGAYSDQALASPVFRPWWEERGAALTASG
ncbi:MULTISPECIES: LysR family transcriptional regulator [Lentzea]|uniref:DNA-binding transcriptional regulator, LysR family n=1 Tax=Lentzea flaviverrucosa TaxID=200379 RepID=A0A1H9GBK7_9PSEU|nr:MULTISPECIES: LysR family transcriptional regulator [Lentzea]MCR3749274.1 DNA-binding transcriptional regulator, LysR family [Lentzea californiensis]RDI34956.1 DNA-binding transcriptional LysR family regulator [Lentzea flaviverrucosa]SEQ47466.1 DNA-binding transcriptional regulator, LysR family [Lentzea flaviverrucosa]